MIYIDASVVLARLLIEDRRPSEALWDEDLVSSRLLSYEIWTRLHARGLSASRAAVATKLLLRLKTIELSTSALARALEPFPVELRTLDGLHIATMVWLKGEQHTIRLASYDKRMIACAEALGIEVYQH